MSLNLSQRKKELSEISRQNFRMVNSLVQVKPQVPLATALDKWSNQQGSYGKRISCVRYGTPKPLQGLSIRLSLNDGNMRREGSQQLNLTTSAN